jgi:hypothetical protein
MGFDKERFDEVIDSLERDYSHLKEWLRVYDAVKSGFESLAATERHVRIYVESFDFRIAELRRLVEAGEGGVE